MALPRTEAQLQKAVVKEIKKRWPDAWVFHPVGSPYQIPGIPDLLCCVRGVMVAMELKFPGPGETDSYAMSRATPQQWNQINQINSAGGMAAVVITVEGAVDLIDRALARFDLE